MTGFSCAGNALLDMYAQVDADFILAQGYSLGGTQHVGPEEVQRLLASINDYLPTAGGGSANTARVLHCLGQSACFAGCVGSDEAGALYSQNLSAAGVETLLQTETGPTGVFIALVDASGRRSIVVSPGVASGLDHASVPPTFFQSPIAHIDGFLAEHPENLLALIQRAKTAGQKISFDVGGRRVTTANRELFKTIIAEYCDWVFLNEDEFLALTGEQVDYALPDLAAEVAATVIVKQAQSGAVCMYAGELIESPVRAIQPVDATGAGDAFAAGFLAAVSQSYPLARALRFANRVAEHAIQVPGMRIDPELLRSLPHLFL